MATCNNFLGHFASFWLDYMARLMLLHVAFYSKISGADKFVNDLRNVCTCKTANRTCKQILAGL